MLQLITITLAVTYGPIIIRPHGRIFPAAIILREVTGKCFKMPAAFAFTHLLPRCRTADKHIRFVPEQHLCFTEASERETDEKDKTREPSNQDFLALHLVVTWSIIEDSDTAKRYI